MAFGSYPMFIIGTGKNGFLSIVYQDRILITNILSHEEKGTNHK